MPGQEVPWHHHLRRLPRLLPPGQHPGLHLTQGGVKHTNVATFSHRVLYFIRGCMFCRILLPYKLQKVRQKQVRQTIITQATQVKLMTRDWSANRKRGTLQRERSRDWKEVWIFQRRVSEDEDWTDFNNKFKIPWPNWNLWSSDIIHKPQMFPTYFACLFDQVQVWCILGHPISQ